MSRTAWILELMPPDEGCGQPFGIVADPESRSGRPKIDVVDDYDIALQFARKVDCDRFLELVHDWQWGRGWLQVVEHQFNLTQDEMSLEPSDPKEEMDMQPVNVTETLRKIHGATGVHIAGTTSSATGR